VFVYLFTYLLFFLSFQAADTDVCDDARFRDVRALFDVLPTESTSARSRPSSRSSVYVMFIYHHLPPLDSVSVLMLVWRIRGKIIRTALCCAMYDSCAQ